MSRSVCLDRKLACINYLSRCKENFNRNQENNMTKYILISLVIFTATVSTAFSEEGNRLNPKYHDIIVAKKGNDVT